MLETLPMWSNVQPQLQPHPACMKLSTLPTRLKRISRSLHGLSNLIDAFSRSLFRKQGRPKRPT
jgi:hypothetical protein